MIELLILSQLLFESLLKLISFLLQLLTNNLGKTMATPSLQPWYIKCSHTEPMTTF